jgi:hypothetical protein
VPNAFLLPYPRVVQRCPPNLFRCRSAGVVQSVPSASLTTSRPVPCWSRTPRCALLAGPAPRPRGRRSGLTGITGPLTPRCRGADATASVCRSSRLTSPVSLPPSSHLAMFGWHGSTCDPEGHGSDRSSRVGTPKCLFRRWRRTRLSFDLDGPLPPRSRCQGTVVGSVVAAAPSVDEHLPAAVASHRGASRCRLARSPIFLRTLEA